MTPGIDQVLAPVALAAIAALARGWLASRNGGDLSPEEKVFIPVGVVILAAIGRVVPALADLSDQGTAASLVTAALDAAGAAGLWTWMKAAQRGAALLRKPPTRGMLS